MPKRLQFYREVTFSHPYDTSEAVSMSLLLMDYIFMWAELNGHLDDFTVRYHNDSTSKAVTITMPNQGMHDITEFWEYTISHTFPNARMTII